MGLVESRDRYSRQILFTGVGLEGQRRLRGAHAAIVGVGALGCQQAALLARAGIGRLDLVDRDFVEPTNLQRQILFTEADAAEGTPKAVAAARALAQANGEVRVEAHVRDLTAATVRGLLEGADLVLDGTDNLEARYLINDFCVSSGKPWIYTAAVGAGGLCMPVIPGGTACLRCVFEDPPPPASLPTCDTAGVLAPATSVIGSVAALEALKILAGRPERVLRGLLRVDLWTGDWRTFRVDGPRPECPCCGRRRFDFLERRRSGPTLALCGRDAVQVSPADEAARVDLASLRRRLERSFEVRGNEHCLRFRVEEVEVVLFADGRAILKGLDDPERARALYARFVGV